MIETIKVAAQKLDQAKQALKLRTQGLAPYDRAIATLEETKLGLLAISTREHETWPTFPPDGKAETKLSVDAMNQAASNTWTFCQSIEPTREDAVIHLYNHMAHVLENYQRTIHRFLRSLIHQNGVQRDTLLHYSSQMLSIVTKSNGENGEVLAALASAKATIATLKNLEAESRGVLTELQRDKGTISIKDYAQHFHTQASRHTTAARFWLGLTAGVAVVLGCKVVNLYTLLWEKDTNSSIAMRVVAVFASYAIVIWLSRNFRAHRHLAVVNEQKALSLSTFGAFEKAAQTADAKAVMLAHAASIVFAPAVTGYLGGDENIPTPVGEVLSSLLKK